MDGICRICLGSGEMISVFESCDSIQLSDKIMSCASVHIMPGDHLPSRICTACKGRLDSSYEFKILCEHSDSKLRSKNHLDPCFPIALVCVKNEMAIDDFGLQIKNENNCEYVNSNKLNENKTENIYTAQTKSKNEKCVLKRKKKKGRKKRIKEDVCHNFEDSLKEESVLSANNEDYLSDGFPSAESSNLETINERSKEMGRVKSRKPSKEQCFTCGKVVSSRFRLKMHMRIHTGEKPFSCGFCQKTFALSQNLKVHERVHTGEKPLLCGACGKSFAQSAGLVAHTRLHTGETPYTCSLCPASFRTPGHLQYHIRQHTGEKKFACSVCSRAFITAGDLKQHTKTHTGERPYVCTTCGLRLSRSSHLTRHMMTHTGEKPHKCGECGSGYAQKGDLLRHVKKHALAKTVDALKSDESLPDLVLDKKNGVMSKVSVSDELRLSLTDARMTDESKGLGFSVGLITTTDS